MTRSQELKKKALKWKVIGGLAFLIGAFMLYQKVYYETRDFYGENFEVFQNRMSEIQLSSPETALLGKAIEEMEGENYWEAVTTLEELKQLNPQATQIAEWYKILCMVGLGEKEEAISLLEYYVEQPDFLLNKARARNLLEEY